eukprot:SAG11_NODE_990_length_6270_cov_38.630044_2_plen_72_part_00
MKNLLKGAAAVQLTPPSEQDAITILMAAAEMPEHATPPSDAAAVIEMCDNLPLSLVMAVSGDKPATTGTIY